MSAVRSDVRNLAKVLAKLFETETDPKRKYLQDWRCQVELAGGHQNPNNALKILAGEIARIHFRRLLDSCPQAKTIYWLDRAEDPEALGLI